MTKDIPQGFYFRESDHAYFFDGKKMTGCTTILGVLNKPALVPWAARMAIDHIRLHSTESTFEAPNLLVSPITLEEAKTAYAKKRDEGAEKGTNTHSLCEGYIKECIRTNGGKPLVPFNPNEESLEAFIEWALRNVDKFLASEEKLYSKELWVAGTADFIFEKGGKVYVGDIKTYKKIWDRTPFYQCAGYGLMKKEMEGTEIAGYVIVNLPKERAFKESEDILWSFDIEGDTKAFLACAEIYRQNAQFKPNYSKK